MFDSSVFSERLRELMIEKSVNASQLANCIQTSKVTIGRYLSEKRTPELSVLVRLADFFEVTIDFLIGLEKESTKKDFKTPNFPKRFEFLFATKKATKYRLEKETHISDESVYSWLKGKNTPSVESLIRLSEFFDCSVDFLIGRTDID